MKVQVYRTHEEMAEAAAQATAAVLRKAILERGQARFVLSTGNSQVVFLDKLCAQPDIDWRRTAMFHLDDYLGLPKDHPGSFDRYLRERLIDKVYPGEYNLIDGLSADPEQEALAYGKKLNSDLVDLCVPGIGETGHLALNDPPADFKTEKPFFVLDITPESRRQLSGEGWFPTPEDCPGRAITISIRQILKSRCLISVVPEARKAPAVARCLEREVSPDYPASILRTHPDCRLFLDADSAGALKRFAAKKVDYPVSFELGS